MQISNKTIIIAGPTASGKTKLAIELAKEINGEIINADSRSIYKGMDIGTGKPTKKEMAGITHHLFDIKNPDEDFSVAEFKKLAKEKIREIQKRSHAPIIVGGTGLYIDALVYDFPLSASTANKKLRERLEKKELVELQKEIRNLGIQMANESEFKNKRRLIRTLEIYYATGEAKSKTRKTLPKNILYFAINIPREELYKKINKRVRDMFIVQKLNHEVLGLLKRYPPDLPSMQTMGYKETIQFLDNETTLEEAVQKTQQAHRKFAKRQLTWFRRNKDIIWIQDLKDLKKSL